MEDYLEAVFYLKNVEGVVRVRDIAAHMGVKMPSVSEALKVLKEKKLVTHEPYAYVELTERGENRAKELLNRHQQLTHFLRDVLGVGSATAEQDACRIEHAISPNSMERLMALIKAMEECKSEHCFISKLTPDDMADSPMPQTEEVCRPVSSLETGQMALVEAVEPHKTLRKKLLDRGFTKGARVEMLSRPAKGKPVSVRIKGYQTSLAPREALLIKVQSVTATATEEK